MTPSSLSPRRCQASWASTAIARAVWLNGALVVLEGEAVEPEADLRRQVGVPAADLGDSVRMLDDPDRLAARVAVDVRLVARDPSRLG